MYYKNIIQNYVELYCEKDRNKNFFEISVDKQIDMVYNK